MNNIKKKIYDWKDRLRKGKMLTLVLTLVTIIVVLTFYSLSLSRKYRDLSENNNNEAFYELVEYIDNTEKLLAKATISSDNKHCAIVLSSAWKTASLAQSYLSRIPIETKNLESANKFLNQVGDYCYVLSKKSIKGENITQEELDNLTNLHDYSIELEKTINQLEEDLYSGNIKWGVLQKNGNKTFSDEKETIEKSSFLSIEEDLHQYTGLIYDGAFSENRTNFKGEGLVGNEINKEEAIEKVKTYLSEDEIKEIIFNGESENSKIKCYNLIVKTNKNDEVTFCISKTGGYLIEMNNNRDVREKNIAEEELINKGKEYLKIIGYKDMKETYYMNNSNILTVNYAYNKDDIVIYPDLIKVKLAMDTGEVIGIEAMNYLNSHNENRNLQKPIITEENARTIINKNLEILGSNLAIIPTEFDTEVFCWEIKGRVKTKTNNNEIENDFIVYINAITGEEEDILLIVDTPNGTLTM